MHTLYLLSVWIHILTAMLWLGGALFISLVIAPALRRPASRQAALATVQAIGPGLRHLGWMSFLVLLLTGLMNIIGRWGSLAPLAHAEFWRTPATHAFAGKLLLFVVILGLSAVHDFNIGPRAADLAVSAPGRPETLRLRRWAAWLGRVNVLLGLVVVACAVIVVRGW